MTHDNKAKTLRAVIIGFGAIGRTHAAAIAALPDIELVGIVGNAEAAARLAPSVASATDPEALITRLCPDIVVIATPGGGHFAVAVAALRLGCHLVVEKPLTIDPTEAARLVSLARRSGRVCSTISQRRLEPQHVHLRKLLAEGALGRPRLIEGFVHWLRTDAYYAERPWRGTVAQGGGSLMNQGIHSLDLMLWLGGKVSSVSAICANLGHSGLEIEDTTLATLAFSSGALGLLVTSTATPPGYPAELRLLTDRGSCVFSQSEVLAWDFPGIAPPPATAAIGSGAADPAAIGIAGHVAQWRDIAEAICAGREPAITFADGCEAVRVVSAIYRASAEKRHVALAEFPESLDGDSL